MKWPFEYGKNKPQADLPKRPSPANMLMDYLSDLAEGAQGRAEYHRSQEAKLVEPDQNHELLALWYEARSEAYGEAYLTVAKNWNETLHVLNWTKYIETIETGIEKAREENNPIVSEALTDALRFARLCQKEEKY